MTKHLQATGYLRAGPVAQSSLLTKHLGKGWKEQGPGSADRMKWTDTWMDGGREGGMGALSNFQK